MCRRQVEPHAQIPRCVDGIGDATVKSDRSVKIQENRSEPRLCPGAGNMSVVGRERGGRRPHFFRRVPTPPLFWTEIRAKVSPLLQLITY